MLRTDLPSKTNGLQCPPNIKQSLIFICYLIISTSYFLFVAAFLVGVRQLILITINGMLATSALVCWYLTIKTNPHYTGNEIKSIKPPISRYCSKCNKHIYGMDHHCVWLNNCIGAKNYSSFYAMLWLGSIQMILQTVVGVLYYTDCFEGVEGHLHRYSAHHHTYSHSVL